MIIKSKVFKTILGTILIVLGLLALITPFTPGSWLAFIGLELLGVRIALWDKFKHKLPGYRKPEAPE